MGEAVSTPAMVLKDMTTSFIFFLFIFNRRIITSLYCVAFCHVTTWINHWYTYPLPLESPFHTPPYPTSPPHPTPLGCYRAPAWTPCITGQLPTSYLFYTNVSMLLSQFIPPSPFPAVSKACSLCLYLLSCSANMFISTIFSRFHIHVLIYEIFFSLPDLLHSLLIESPPFIKWQLLQLYSNKFKSVSWNWVFTLFPFLSDFKICEGWVF